MVVVVFDVDVVFAVAAADDDDDEVPTATSPGAAAEADADADAEVADGAEDPPEKVDEFVERMSGEEPRSSSRRNSSAIIGFSLMSSLPPSAVKRVRPFKPRLSLRLAL